MGKNRLEAFTTECWPSSSPLWCWRWKYPLAIQLPLLHPVLPIFESYVLSFVYLGIYWNNHHHMLHTTQHVTGGILWANLHLLFWLSLFPFVTGWIEKICITCPCRTLWVVLLMAGHCLFVLERAIICSQGPDSLLAKAVGDDYKGKVSPYSMPQQSYWPFISLDLS